MPRRNASQLDLLSYRPSSRKPRLPGQPLVKIRRVQAGYYEWVNPDGAVIAEAVQGSVAGPPWSRWGLTFYAYEGPPNGDRSDPDNWTIDGDDGGDPPYTLRDAKREVEKWAIRLEETQDRGYDYMGRDRSEWLDRSVWEG